MEDLQGSAASDDLDLPLPYLESVLSNAAAFNAIGQGALDKGCPKEARAIFLSVIDQFQGEAFAAARDRAKIGVDDARAAE